MEIRRSFFCGFLVFIIIVLETRSEAFKIYRESKILAQRRKDAEKTKNMSGFAGKPEDLFELKV